MAHDLNQPAGSAPLVFDMTSAGPSAIRDAIVSAVMAFLAAEDARTLEDVRACLDRELDTDALVALSGRLGSIVGDWTYCRNGCIRSR